MTRLFFRFYLGVLLILLVAWYLEAWVSRYNVDEQNALVIVRAMSGSVRLSRDWLNMNEDLQPEALTQIRQRFEFPVDVLDIQSPSFPAWARPRLREYDRIVLYESEGLFVATRLQAEGRIVTLGPLPRFVGPQQTAMLTALAAILVLVAVAIAFLLRPVTRQLQAVERTASAIADGDLSARIDGGQVPQGRPLAAAFNTMADRTETLLRAQRELLQAVSHDLRTPLARIRFAVDLIGSAKTDEERHERLLSLDTATEELDGLVGELLNYVRLETADLLSRVEPHRVAELVTTLIEYRREMYPHLTFEIDIPAELRLPASQAGLNRVLVNLIGNACRYAESQVRVSAREEGLWVSLRVEDDGPGIAEEDRQRVLHPFVRLPQDSDQPENSSGVGLGLALVSRIVGRHRGQVSISTSDLGGCQMQTDWPREHPLV